MSVEESITDTERKTGKYTIGTDPELFLKEEESGKFKSSIPFLSGTKDDPDVLECGSGLQRDNVALEFATPPKDNETDFVRSIQDAFTNIVKKIPEGHEMVAVPSANFDEDQLDHPEAKRFGCSPDYDAYIPAQNPPAHCDDPTFRSCGAHIHAGYVEGSGNDFLLDPWGKINTILTMDAVHGIISVVLDNSKEALERRKLYGKAGCHRPTDYGVEYRSLSNFWIKSPELVMLMYRLTDDALRLMRENKSEDLIDSIGRENMQRIINEGIIDEAIDVLDGKIRPALSAESIEMLDMCLEKCESYEFKKEWKLEAQ